MSDSHKNFIDGLENKDEWQKKNNIKAIIGCLVALILVLTVSVIMLGYKLYANNINNLGISTEGSEGEVDLSTLNTGRLISGAEREECLNLVNSAISNIRSKNILLMVEGDSSTNVVTLYNKYGEAIVEDTNNGYKTFYRKDHSVIKFLGSYVYGYDRDVITMLEVAKNLAIEDSDNFKVLESATKYISANHGSKLDSYAGIREIYIDICGWDNISKMYNEIDEGFSRLMIEQLKASIKQISETVTRIDPDSALNMRLVYVLDGDKLIDGACYTWFGDVASEDVLLSDLSLNWIFKSYVEVLEWKLDDNWYTVNWDSIETWTDDSEDLIKAIEVLDTQLEIISEMLNTYSEMMAEKSFD